MTILHVNEVQNSLVIWALIQEMNNTSTDTLMNEERAALFIHKPQHQNQRVISSSGQSPGSCSCFSWTEVSWRSSQTGLKTRIKDILIRLTSTPAWRWPYIHHTWHSCVCSEHSASGAQCLLSYSNSDHFPLKSSSETCILHKTQCSQCLF